MNIARWLQGHAKEPDRLALTFEDREWSYGDVDAVTSRVASGLARLGVEPGDRVGCMLPNWPEFHFTTHGTWKAGAVEVPINTMFRAEEVEFVLGDSRATAVVASPETAAVISGVRDRLPDLRAVVVAGTCDVPGTVSFEELLELGDPGARAAEVAADDLAVIAYTSGTTGFPKGAMLDHANVVVSMEALARYLDLGRDDNVLQVLPCFHSNASLIGIVFAWYLGSTAVLLERFEPERFVETVRARRPAFFAFVPTLLHDLSRMEGTRPARSRRCGT
ncbi:MAG: AMP-binding protein [Acidimicrobiia bacterium]|nr:AMP-binding protein [Acidimicrobiia bacterium]